MMDLDLQTQRLSNGRRADSAILHYRPAEGDMLWSSQSSLIKTNHVMLNREPQTASAAKHLYHEKAVRAGVR